MTTTEELLKAARDLGTLLVEHPAAAKFRELVATLDADAQAKQLLQDYDAAERAIAEKLSAQQPVEVDDKRTAQELKQQVAMHPVLREMPMIEADYVNLMRQVNDAIMGDPAARGD
ncbi:MAG: YlbF family regulator [Phycisphaerales bacterium]|nr:YlbF family regulator [Phycisphaerales bacterium]